MSDGSMSRLLIMCGPESRYPPPSRTLMFPPLPSTYCLSHNLRPTVMISTRSAWASGELAALSGEGSSWAQGAWDDCGCAVAGRAGGTSVGSMIGLTRGMVWRDAPGKRPPLLYFVVERSV